MQIELTPELQEMIDAQIATGRYSTPAEVLRAALSVLEGFDLDLYLRRKEISKLIDEGLASLERGEGADGDEFFDQLEREEHELAQKRAS